MKKKQTRYLSYLLRLWQTSDSGDLVWRASLECPGTGERKGFPSLSDLFAYLETQTERQLNDDADSLNKGGDGIKS
jgi:hypothetical protein